MLEALPPMPAEKRRVRLHRGQLGDKRLAGAVDDRLHARPVIDLARDQDVELFGQADQPAPKRLLAHIHCAVPHRGPSALSLSTGAVLDAVGPAVLDRLDGHRLRLGAAAAID